MKSEKPQKVSIIIPAYNVETLLPACLKALRNLDYLQDHIEIIVVDNGSTDRTRQIAEHYRAKVYRKDSGNVARLRNFGVKNSSGEIIAFVDADCLVSHEWLSNAATYFDDLRVVAWGVPALIPQNATWVQKAWYLVRQKKEVVEEVEWLESMNFFLRRRQFLEVGGFNESLETCEDVDLCYRLRKFGNIISDSRIKLIHLGEAATIKQFFRKEIWRGRSNLKGVLSHGLLVEELHSLLIPLYFGVLLPTLLGVLIISLDAVWSVVLLTLYVIPTLLVTIKIKCKRVGASIYDLFKLSLLLQVYFVSRTIAVLKIF